MVVFTMKHRGQVMPFSLRDHIFRLGAMAPRDLPHEEFDLLVKKMTGKIRTSYITKHTSIREGGPARPPARGV